MAKKYQRLHVLRSNAPSAHHQSLVGAWMDRVNTALVVNGYPPLDAEDDTMQASIEETEALIERLKIPRTPRELLVEMQCRDLRTSRGTSPSSSLMQAARSG